MQKRLLEISTPPRAGDLFIIALRYFWRQVFLFLLLWSCPLFLRAFLGLFDRAFSSGSEAIFLYIPFLNFFREVPLIGSNALRYP